MKNPDPRLNPAPTGSPSEQSKMFFIVPKPRSHILPESSPLDKPIVSAHPRPGPIQHHSFDNVASYYPRRTPKACDRCRIKKARCSAGRGPCTKCKRDGVICVTTAPSKSERTVKNNPAYVQMVEAQRDALVQALHRVLKEKGNSISCSIDVAALLDRFSEVQNEQSPQASPTERPLNVGALPAALADLRTGSSSTPSSTFNSQLHPADLQLLDLVTGASTPDASFGHRLDFVLAGSDFHLHDDADFSDPQLSESCDLFPPQSHQNQCGLEYRQTTSDDWLQPFVDAGSPTDVDLRLFQ